MRIVSWNVASLLPIEPFVRHQAGREKDPPGSVGLDTFFDRLGADIVCLQETKIVPDRVQSHLGKFLLPEEWESYWSVGQKKGYCGVATYTRKEWAPLAVYTDKFLVRDIDDEGLGDEGRLVVTDHGSFVLFNVYVPNGGEPPERPRLAFKLRFLDGLLSKMEELRLEGRSVVLVGDLNIISDAVKDNHPGLRVHYAGAEYQWFRTALGPYADTFRELHPTRTDAYTCFAQIKDNRGRNWGTRIDYGLISRDTLLPLLRGADVMNTPERMSDHTAISVDLALLPPSTSVRGAYKPLSECVMKAVTGSSVLKSIAPDKTQGRLKSFFTRRSAAEASKVTAVPDPAQPPPSLSEAATAEVQSSKAEAEGLVKDVEECEKSGVQSAMGGVETPTESDGVPALGGDAEVKGAEEVEGQNDEVLHEPPAKKSRLAPGIKKGKKQLPTRGKGKGRSTGFANGGILKYLVKE